MDRDLRSIVAWIVHFLNGLGILAATCFLIWHYFRLGRHNESLGTDPGLVESVGWALTGGIILVAANILRLLYLRPTGSVNEDYILSQGGSNGQGVRIAVEAIRSELKSAAEEQIPALSRCRVTVMRPGPKRVRIMASYVACEGSNIMELSRKLRRVITDRFREMVPLGEGVRLEVEIDFESFGGKPPKEGLEEKKKEGESAPFTGPKYPVDGEV